MEEDDYLQVIVESETHQAYLFEPEQAYTEEQFQRRDQEEAAAVASGVDVEQQRVGDDTWCLCTNWQRRLSLE